MRLSGRVFGLVAASLALLLDQGIKGWVVAQLAQPLPLIPGLLTLVLSPNPGAAFGFTPESHPLLRELILFAIPGAVLLLLGWLLWKADDPLNGMAWGVILGGGLGNLIDRLRLGHVVDFIKVHWGESFALPVFNSADCFLGLGVFFLFVAMLRERRRG